MAHLLLEDGARRERIALAPDLPARIGRALGGAVVLEDQAASREHAALERTPQGWCVRDLGSRNGTRLNGRPLAKDEPRLLRPGDRIEIGKAVLTFAGDGATGDAAARALEQAARAREATTASAASLAQDPMTGIASFPLLLHELRARLALPADDETATLRPAPVALVLVDVDELPLLHDLFGFRSGEEVVRQVALELQAAVVAIEGAVCAREGGGKFGLLLPGFDGARATAFSEELRARIVRRALDGPLKAASVTVSAGVASSPEDAGAWRDLWRRAEAALARARREGRDRVARPPEPSRAASASAAPGVGLSGVFALAPTAGKPDELAPLLLTKDGRDALALVARALGSDLDLEPLLDVVLTIAVERTNARRGCVVLRDPAAGELRLVASLDRDASSDPRRSLVVSHGILKQALQAREVVRVDDALADARFKKRASVVLDRPRSVLVAPLVLESEPEALGALYLDHRGEAKAFAKEHEELARAIARLLAGPVRRLERGALAKAELARARLLLERTAEVESERHASQKGLIGESEVMREVRRSIERAAASDLPVAIQGESGTGKELVARAIHALGARAKAPFVAENVAALPETLLEAEIFGHAQGAFTGADQDRAGLFEAANGGTLFLDEVALMSPRLQAKLLRVLQEHEVRRVGEETSRKIDVRLVTATNENLEELAKEGRFRTDLLYRIRVLTVDVPPLRARREDVPRLLEHFLALARPGNPPRVSRDALALLVHHEWPGNVRELENEARKLAALGSAEIGTSDLSPAIRGKAGPDAGARRATIEDGAQALLAAIAEGKSLTEALEAFERDAIARILDEVEGNRTKAARRLGITRQGLHKKLKRYGFDT